MTYDEMVNLEKEYWNKYWEGPIPEPVNHISGRPLEERDLSWLGAIFWTKLNLGLTKKEIKQGGFRTWTKEKLTEYCQRCMKLAPPLLETLVEMTWASLGQYDARRSKVGMKLYREAEPDELLPQIVPRVGSEIIYEKNGVTAGRCTVKEKYEKGWLGIQDNGTIVTGTDLEVIELVLLDNFRN